MASGQWLVASANTRAVNPQSPAPSPRSPAPLFSIRTPTAVVIDLGTEFGVEVSENGETTSLVFRGSVLMQPIFPSAASRRGAGGEGRAVLRANESARVERGVGGDPRLVLSGEVGNSPKFVRRIYEPPKQLDLLDIVAGGDGLGNRRERGINPANGAQDRLFVAQGRGGDRQYWPVVWHQFIDGVFVPDGGTGPVQLDSVEHVFDGFPDTRGQAIGSIWPRAADVKSDERAKDPWNWVYFMGRGEQFMPEGRGLLGLHANAGITFNLLVARRMWQDTWPTRFRAVAGLASADGTSAGAGMADIWVFVDGRLKQKRLRLRPQDGTVDVDVELGPSDRFLTLVVTDGGNGYEWDYVVFGDPVLEMRLY